MDANLFATTALRRHARDPLFIYRTLLVGLLLSTTGVLLVFIAVILLALLGDKTFTCQ